MEETKNYSRRDFVKLGLISTSALGLIGTNLSSAFAAEEYDKAIVAQDYVRDHTVISKDTNHKNFKKFDDMAKKLDAVKKGALPNCSNCKLYMPKDAPKGYGKCVMVQANGTGTPKKYVAEGGWCKVYQKVDDKTLKTLDLIKKS